MKVRGLYAIADRGVSPGEDLVALARDYLEGGASIVQLRDKHRLESEQSRREFLRVAGKIAELKKTHDFLFIVNDEPGIAREVGADGVHVGQDDSSIAECREILGKGRLVGYSSHTLEEAVAAERQGADYVAFGAIYPTPTKGPGHPVQGLDKLRAVVQSVTIPVVAIGGIGRDTIKDVLAAGAASVAMISALAHAKDRIAETRFFSRFFETVGKSGGE